MDYPADFLLLLLLMFFVLDIIGIAFENVTIGVRQCNTKQQARVQCIRRFEGHKCPVLLPAVSLFLQCDFMRK